MVLSASRRRQTEWLVDETEDEWGDLEVVAPAPSGGDEFGDLEVVAPAPSGSDEFGDLEVVAPVPTPSTPRLNVEDISAYTTGRKALSVRKKDVVAAPPEVARALREAAEIGARSQLTPRAVKTAVEDREALPGEMTDFQKFFDYADAAFLATGKAANRAVLASVNRMADTAGLARMPHEERVRWVDNLDDRYVQKKAYRKIIDQMKRVEDENPGTTWRDLYDSPSVANAGGDLLIQYLKPANTADTYGGGAPRPWSVMGNRQPDVVDIVMRGVFDMDDEQVEFVRPRVQATTAKFGAPFRAIMSGIDSILPAAGAADGSPLKFYDELFERYKKKAFEDEEKLLQRIEAGDRTAGMTFANFILSFGTDVFVPPGQSARMVDTTIGRISEEAAVIKASQQAANTGKVVADAKKLRGSELTGAEVALLERQVNTQVDNLFTLARQTANGPIGGIDTSRAISVVDTPQGFLVKGDPSKVTTVPAVNQVSAFFPKPSLAVKAASSAKTKVIGALTSGEVTLPLVRKTVSVGDAGVKVARAVNAARGVFGKGPSLLVETSAGTRALQPSDLLGGGRWELVRDVMGRQRRATRDAVNAVTNKVVSKVWNQTLGPVERNTVRKFAETIGAPGIDVGNAGLLFKAMENAVSRSLELAPQAVHNIVTKSDLNSPILQAMNIKGAEASLLADAMESMTGFRSASDAAASAALVKELRSLSTNAAMTTNNAKLAKSLADMSLADAKQAARAWSKIASGKQSLKEFQNLSPEAKDALQAIRNYFDNLYENMKASGQLGKGYTKEQFFERVGVGGFVPHMLSKAGRGKMLAALRSAGVGDAKGKLSTVISSTKMRKNVGTIDELNQKAREDVAAMVLEAEAQYGKAIPGETFDEGIARVIDELGLDSQNLWETDLTVLIPKYGASVANGLANQAMMVDLINIFPAGERFAATFMKDRKGGLVPALRAADEAAAQAGYRRASGVTILRSIDPELTQWDGWSKNAETISGILDNFSPESVNKALDKLRELGAPIDDTVTAASRPELVKPAYFPSAVVDELEELAKPSLWSNMRQIVPEDIRELADLGVNVLRDMTAVWKAGVTVYNAAFHGMNYMGNVVSSVLRNPYGLDAISPSNQIRGMKIKLLPDDADVVVPMAGGTPVSMKAGEWRRALGISGDTVPFIDDRLPGASFKVSVPRAVKTAAATTAAGALAGAATAEKPEDRIRQAFFGGMMGAGIGGAASSSFDLYLRGGVKAADEATGLISAAKGALKAAPSGPAAMRDAASRAVAGRDGVRAGLKAAAEESLGQIMESIARAGRAGTGAGALSAAWLSLIGAEKGVEAAKAAALSGLTAGTFSMINDAVIPLTGGFGKSIEDIMKISNGLAVFRRTGSLSDARRVADVTLFDYDNLTRIEKQVFRNLIPFYTWNSKNIALQADLLVNYPGRYNTFVKLTKALESDYEAYELPEYYGNRWIIHAGLGKVLAGARTGPEAAVEWMTKGPAGIGSMTHPLLKSLIEIMGKESLYYGVPFDRITRTNDYAKMPDIIKRAVGYAEDVIDPQTGKVLPPQIGYFEFTTEELAEKSPEEYARTIRGKSGKRYRSDIPLATMRHQAYSNHPVKRILTELNKSLLESFVPSVDGVMPPEEATTFDRALALTTGLRVRQVRPKTTQDYEYQTLRLLDEALQVGGVGYKQSRLPVAPRAPRGQYLIE